MYRKDFIATRLFDQEFFEGTKVEGKNFYLTEKGRRKLLPWFKKSGNWVFIFTSITALIS